MLDHLADVIAEAEDRGLDGVAAVRTRFPDVPLSVLGEASWVAEERRADAWWTIIVKIIDAKVIEAALLKQGGAE